MASVNGPVHQAQIREKRCRVYGSLVVGSKQMVFTLYRYNNLPNHDHVLPICILQGRFSTA